jgi:hypothetical protein
MNYPRVNREARSVRKLAPVQVQPTKQAPMTGNTPTERPKLRAIFRSIGRGLIDAVPFVGPVINSVGQADENSNPGAPNWPRIISSIVSGIVALAIVWAILTKALPIETAKEILDLIQVF